MLPAIYYIDMGSIALFFTYSLLLNSSLLSVTFVKVNLIEMSGLSNNQDLYMVLCTE